MDINSLERANILAKCLIPKTNSLLDIRTSSNERIGEFLNGLLKGDKEFETKFMQLLSETKQRLQKEFDEL